MKDTFIWSLTLLFRPNIRVFEKKRKNSENLTKVILKDTLKALDYMH